MGYASEAMIEEHNRRWETDECYREECYDLERSIIEAQWAEDERLKQIERQINWFADYRLATDGYEEFDVPGFDSGELFYPPDGAGDELPF